MHKLFLITTVLLAAAVAFAQQSPTGQGPTDLNGGLTNAWTNVFAGAGPNNVGGPGLGRHDLQGGTSGAQPLGCESCHLPHSAPKYGASFLWAWSSVPTNVTTYVTETNPSAVLVTPAGRSGNTRSMLCLTCHDGTSASNNNILANNTASGLPFALINTAGGSGSLGSQHPVNAVVPPTADFVQPAVLSTIGAASASATIGVDSLPLWGPTYTVECTTCHDPHNDYQVDTPYGVGGVPFLRVANTNGTYLCRECHNQ
jgi:hypothetical protein